MITSHGLRAAAGNPDPFFNQTVMLLHGDGTNGGQNNTFIDGSTNNFTVTRNGNATQGSFSPFSLPEGWWSNYLDGSGDYLSLASNATLSVGANQFTFEVWMYSTATLDSQALYAITGGNDRLYIGMLSGSFVVRRTGVSNIVSVSLPSANQWVHIAVTRDSSNDIRVFFNGVQQGSTVNSSHTFVTGVPNIGANVTNNQFTGYLSNLRLIVGSAVYTSAFTPPTTPLTAITNTALITCQSNRLIDNSSNAFAITRNGDARVLPFSPFESPGAYSTVVNGGAGYFDGTDDYLTVADNAALEFPTQDFTIEAWIYLLAIPASTATFAIAQKGLTASSNFEYTLRVYNNAGSGQLELSYSSNGTTVTSSRGGTITAGQWTHVAATRTGATMDLWVNGVDVGGTASFPTTMYSGTGTFAVGANSNAENDFNGYITNVRIVKGSRVYTSTFTPPTAPLTAITNTTLLLNCENASVVDNTGKNVLETVGNSQIDTTTKVFGTGSLEFDGTGDWLLVPNSPDTQLGTGNFTIEFWVYLNATGAARGFVGKGAATTGWLVSLVSTNTVRFTYGSSTITSTGTLAGSTWYYIAVVRSGTGTNQTKIYINGTNDGTGTVATDFNQTESMYIGANRTGGDALNGFLDDLRITKGVARYTANYPVPTKPFQDR